MKIYVGTSGYGYKEWKGKFYPQKIAPKEMLGFYSERFNTVEINNTFYRMPTLDVLTSWDKQVPDDFVFALKAPQVITHFKRLKNVGNEAEYLFNSLSVLKNKLGPVLFQFPGSFPLDYELLKDFLGLIPKNRACAFEFRSPSWTDEKILALLQQKNFSLCTADTDEQPAAEIIPTAAWGYLRLRHSDYREEDLSLWMEKLLAQKWEKAFVFFKHEEEAIGPKTAVHFKELLPSKR
jgi:uncharacterized protein YecE (DUF72 family)